jgi:hypothetical protein
MQYTSQPQYEVRFRVPEDRLWRGEEGRDLIANLFESDPHPALAPLFHHNGDGSLAQGVPTIRFRGGRGFFGIVAVGEPAIDRVQSIERVIRRGIAERYEQPIRSESLDTQCSIGLSERAKIYRAHLVVFARNHRSMKTKFEYEDNELLMYLRGMALRDIRGQAKALELEIPSEQFPFQILEVGRRGRVPLNKPGQKLYVGYVKHIDFLTTLDFKGAWTLGGMNNRGYGSIRPYRAQAGASRPKARVSGGSYAQL